VCSQISAHAPIGAQPQGQKIVSYKCAGALLFGGRGFPLLGGAEGGGHAHRQTLAAVLRPLCRRFLLGDGDHGRVAALRAAITVGRIPIRRKHVALVAGKSL